jgi:hypothetical protein
VTPLARALLAELRSDPEALAELRAALDALTPASRPTGDDGRDDGYLAPAAAARYLGISRKRVYDLTSCRAIVPDGRDGRTPLFLRATLDSYARSSRR